MFAACTGHPRMISGRAPSTANTTPTAVHRRRPRADTTVPPIGRLLLDEPLPPTTARTRPGSPRVAGGPCGPASPPGGEAGQDHVDRAIEYRRRDRRGRGRLGQAAYQQVELVHADLRPDRAGGLGTS